MRTTSRWWCAWCVVCGVWCVVRDHDEDRGPAGQYLLATRLSCFTCYNTINWLDHPHSAFHGNVTESRKDTIGCDGHGVVRSWSVRHCPAGCASLRSPFHAHSGGLDLGSGFDITAMIVWRQRLWSSAYNTAQRPREDPEPPNRAWPAGPGEWVMGIKCR